jgi:dCTP deaminase
MSILSKAEILERLNAHGPTSLHISPLLDEGQIGEVTVDLRLGYDFLVSVQTRKPFISLPKSDDAFRGASSYFQTTRRDIGDRFTLYPNQVVLSNTLEFVGLPSDVFADVIARSSYARLGIHLNTMVQPGFRGCFPLELVNHGNNPIELIVGSRIVQARLSHLSRLSDYGAQDEARKYIGDVRPVVSKASDDADISILEAIRKSRT